MRQVRARLILQFQFQLIIPMLAEFYPNMQLELVLMQLMTRLVRLLPGRLQITSLITLQVKQLMEVIFRILQKQS